MDVPAAPRLSPEEQLETFKIAPGFRVELVASEPMVETPVALNWDADGRMWAVEMRAYMPNVDGTGEDALVGRVSVLEDTDGDGRMDKSTVFLDKLNTPRALAFVEGGVLVSEPPNLWYCKDTDGDLVCDEKVAVAKYGRQGPVEHTENGLLPALDNWMYNAKSSRRFQFRDGKIVEQRNVSRGQWGIAQDNYGRLYANGNSSWLHADWIPGDYRYRNPHHEIRWGYQQRVVATSEVFSIRVNPGINRGYQGSMLKPDGRLARVTAISGPTIYRGDQFPEEYVGDGFVPEPGANVVGLWRIEEDGIQLKSTHATYPDPKWEKREFLCSTDERFRPVNLYTGPDGCLYVCDIYRGILQHKHYVTTFLRKQIIERKLDKHIDAGRVWRVVHVGSGKPARAPRLSQASSEGLVQKLAHPNGWVRDTAQRLLVERRDESSVQPLRKLATSSKNHLARIHALWALRGIDQIDAASVVANFSHSHPKVRQAAVHTSEPLLPDAKLLGRLGPLAGDGDEGVRLQVLLSLGEADGHPDALAAIARLLEQYGADSKIRDAAMSGLGGREAIFLSSLLETPGWLEDGKGRGEVLKTLAVAIFRSGKPNQVGVLLATMAGQENAHAWRQRALLKGILGAKSKPVKFKNKPAALALLEKSPDKEVRTKMPGLYKLLTWEGDTRSLESGGTPLSESELKLLEVGRLHYAASCMVCHLADGRGQPAVAPPLANSEWVTGSEQKLIRIVLDGLMGPVTVDGQEWNLVMPPHRTHPTLTDERIAGILTYIRREWGHEATPVRVETVTGIRKRTVSRTIPWTVKDLEDVK